MTLAEASAAAAAIDARAANDAIPRAYNFAADIIGRNIKAGRADKPAYIDPLGTWTYGQLAERVERFGRVLRSLGIRREERICSRSPTRSTGRPPSSAPSSPASSPVPVNTLMTEDDYRFMLVDSRAKVLVVSEALFPKFARLIGSSPDLVQVIVSGDERARPSPLRGSDGGARRPYPHTAPTTRDDMCFWLYTSGSTGRPKGAVHTHADLRLTADLYAAGVLGLNETDVCYSVAKLFFAYGLGNALTFPMAVGATTVLLPDRPTPELVGALLRWHPVDGILRACRPSTPRCSPARARRSAGDLKLSLACRPARRCRPTSAAAGKSVTASTSSTALARPRCCTSSSRIIPAR